MAEQFIVHYLQIILGCDVFLGHDFVNHWLPFIIAQDTVTLHVGNESIQIPMKFEYAERVKPDQ
jgi:hypothetical protein